MLVLCHLQMRGQALTNAAPPTVQSATENLPDEPAQQLFPIAQPEPAPASGIPVEWEAQNQSRAGDTWTLTGGVVVHYRDYILRADKVVYHQSTTELEAEGHLQLAGGPNDIHIYADHGDMRLNQHTARFFNVHGSQGVRSLGRTTVYSTTTPFLFTARVLLETGEDRYKIIDGTMTNCRLPRPDWQIISRAIALQDGKASTANAVFKFLGVPIFYLPYLRHPMDETGRESGFLIPTPENSSTKGLVLGEQYYWVISRNMDMIVGLDYYSKRGWAPNGDFRYKGPGLDHAAVRWNALLDRGIEELVTPAATSSNPMPTPVMQFVNQGGVDITALGRKDLTPETRLAGNIDYLSSYLYRLVFNDNYWLAVSSEVLSSLSLTHAHRGFIPSISLDRFQSFAGTTATSDEASVNGNQARILHTPSLRFDVLDRPLRTAPLYWGMGSSLDFLTRSEPGFHARNTGRIDFYPHLTLPLNGGGWSLVAQGALRETAYTLSQIPGTRSSGSSAIPSGTPTISHDPLNRTDFEGSVDLRPPAIERDFSRDHGNRQLRHVLEPEFTYRYVTGIGSQAQNVLLVDTTDIASNTNEVGYSLTQRFYLHTNAEKPCPPEDTDTKGCSTQAREWASWQIAQKYYLDPNFGGALILHRRNVFDSTLDLSGIAFLTSPRNLAPVISRLRFEAVHNLRVQWDLDYNPRDGEFGADNLFAGYSWGRTTIGVTHALLNAVDENGAHATTIKSQQIQPFFSIGKPSGKGFNLAANGGYDYVLNALQYAGAEAVYNWDCCGLSFGYRRFELGSIRNETTWLYSFTLANFGSVPGINRTKSVFRDPSLPPAY